MSSKRLTPVEKEQLLGLMRDNVPTKEIAEAVGVSTAMISYYADRTGIPRPGRRGPDVPAETGHKTPADSVARLFTPPPSWQADALCAQTDPEIFFPEKGGSTAEAEKVCARCPVAAECLDYALDNDERFGVWGGATLPRRRRLAKSLIAS